MPEESLNICQQPGIKPEVDLAEHDTYAGCCLGKKSLMNSVLSRLGQKLLMSVFMIESGNNYVQQRIQRMSMNRQLKITTYDKSVKVVAKGDE